MKVTNKKSFKLASIFIWLILTLSLAIWWMVFAFNLTEKAAEQVISSVEVLKLKKMLIWEGVTWMLLLLVGGIGLVYMTIKEQKNLEKVRGFVAAFSHDLKTSLTSLRLQAESLAEDVKEPSSKKLINRMLLDTVRLQNQLENSLYLAAKSRQNIYMQEISLKNILNRLNHHWPELKINFKGNDVVKADDRAIEAIFRNLIHNAVVHGKAKNIIIESNIKDNKNLIEFMDDGSGFKGDFKQLGQLFYRHNPSSGSGVGLFIVKNLMADMGGSFKVISNNSQGSLKFNLFFAGGKVG